MSEEAIVPDLFTTDYIGEPGRRSFFLQVRYGDVTRTLTIEKQQVMAVGEKLAELLLMIDPDDPVKQTPAGRDPLFDAIPMPGEWRVGTVGIAYDESSQMFIIDIAPLEEEPEEETMPDPSGSLRIALRKDVVRAFALHALAVVSEGRPECQLCGLPMDPDGHKCPATNGHHPR